LQYGFTNAGNKLEKAIQKSKKLVEEKLAATSLKPYQSPYYWPIVAGLLLYVFDAQTNNILTQVKHNNYGKLKKKLIDIYKHINFQGTYLYYTKITEQYLESKIQILEWTVAIEEINQRRKEEQRIIKERMREEIKVQREFERSVREAAKEEEKLRKLMETIKREREAATEEQRSKNEPRLAELEEKLRIAEEKNQRALSMAQQTKAGHVYIISNIGSFGEDIFKIGLTRRLEPLDRIHELGSASVPFAFDVHAMMFSEDAPALETQLHRQFLKFQVNKVNPRKEFFRVPISEIKKKIDELGIRTLWTIEAEAKHYRETLAIEKAIEENPIKAKEWLERQTLFEAALEDDELEDDDEIDNE
jgi:hypothetical protein